MNKTTLAALLVLALMVASIVPFVAAQEGEQQEETMMEAGEETAEAQDTPKEIAQNKFEEAREALKHQAETKREELNTKRQEARTKIATDRMAIKELHQNAIEALKQDRERLKQLHAEFKEKRQELKQQREDARKALGEVREEVRKCAGDRSENCIEARTQARRHANTFLNRAAEHILSVLANARDRVENAKNLADDEKAAALAEIDAALADVAAAKETVASLGENATKEDIKDATAVIRDTWAKAKDAIKQGVGKAASARIGGIVEKMEHLKAKFDRVIAQLKKQGKNTGAAESKIADFNAKLDAASQMQAEAKALFEAGDHPAAAEKVRLAHQSLKDAQNLLKGIVQEIRGIGGGKDLEAESGDADEEEDGESEDDENTATNSTSTGAAA